MKFLGIINKIGFIFGVTVLLQLGQIQSQISNCEKIYNGVCLSCNKGFALSSNRLSCITSPVPDCIYVDSYNMCIECSCGLVVNESGNQCINLSIEGCRQINASNVCIKAKPFYMITPQGVYFNQNNNCAMKSNIWNTADCSECHEGYYLLNGGCQEIATISDYANTYATIFEMDSTNTLSFSCQQGWYAITDVGTPNGCFLTIPNCIQFSQSGQLSQCVLCDTGYISSNGAQICTKITNQLSNCVEIISPTSYTCIRCESEDYKVGLNGCITRTKINNCSQHDPAQDKCLVCNDSYYLSAPNTCTARTNITNCLTYINNADQCASCTDVTLFYFQSATKQCTSRTQINVNCQQYTVDKDECALCSQTYYLLNGVCTLRTVLNCITGYPKDDKCSLCYYDYILKPDGTCLLDNIIKQCLSIDASGVCNQCVSNYGITQNGYECIDNFRNIPLCKIYVLGDSSVCQQCEGDFILTTDKKQCLLPYGSCKQKQDNCKVYLTALNQYESFSCQKSLEADQAFSSIIQFNNYLMMILFMIVQVLFV